MNKFNAQKINVNEIIFDSKKEAKRYNELKLLESSKIIENLEIQKKFELIPKQIVNGIVKERAVNYIADFVYKKNGKMVVEDVKGYKAGTAYSIYVIKRKLMLFKYNIEIKEI